MQKKAGKARRTGRGLMQIVEAPTTPDARAEWVESKKPMRRAGVDEMDTSSQEDQQDGQVKTAYPV
jgi:hypothetical protein